MLNCQRQNYHHSKIPTPGSIGRITGLKTVDPKRKCIVTAYSLTDGAVWRGHPMSYGIHTIWVRFLDNQEIHQFSAIFFEEDEHYSPQIRPKNKNTRKANMRQFKKSSKIQDFRI